MAAVFPHIVAQGARPSGGMQPWGLEHRRASPLQPWDSERLHSSPLMPTGYELLEFASQLCAEVDAAMRGETMLSM